MNEALERYYKAVAKFADKCHAACIKSQFASRMADYDISVYDNTFDEEELLDLIGPEVTELGNYIYRCALVGVDRMRVHVRVDTDKTNDDMEYIVEHLMIWCQARHFGYVVHVDDEHKTTIDIIW